MITLFLLVTIVFLIVNVLPVEPGAADPGPFAPQATVDAINEELGHERPLLDQYGRLLQGRRHVRLRRLVPVQASRWATCCGRHSGARPSWSLFGLVLTVPLAIAAGMFAARRRNTIADRAIVTLGAGQLVDPRVRLRRHAAVRHRRQARLVRGRSRWPHRLRASSPSSTTSCCRRRARRRVLRVHRPHDAGRHDPGARRRLHAHRGDEGPRRPAGDAPPRDAQRAAADGRRDRRCRSATCSAA